MMTLGCCLESGEFKGIRKKSGKTPMRRRASLQLSDDQHTVKEMLLQTIVECRVPSVVSMKDYIMIIKSGVCLSVIPGRRYPIGSKIGGTTVVRG
jgi:hypothetical protein